MICRSILPIAILLYASTALAAPQIWKYSFLSRTDEPIAGYGAAVFKEDKGFRIGPLRSKEGDTFVVAFTFADGDARGFFAAEGELDSQAEIRGSVSRRYDKSQDGCLVRVQLSGTVTHVLLERVDDSC